jgi:hypothetical protein
MGKRLAAVQSSYIPWKGYFDLIRASDEFILLDDVQFTIRDWRTRNRIKTQHGPAWLTIPVQTRGKRHQSIGDAMVADADWGDRHWRTISANYARTPWFETYAPRLEPLFRQPVSRRLSEINRSFLEALCAAIGIGTSIRWSTDYVARSGRNERLVDLCVAAGATEYLSGPAARAYLDTQAFADAGIAVTFVDYAGYGEYEQPYPPFEHLVSAVDLVFCTGPRALEYMKSL